MKKTTHWAGSLLTAWTLFLAFGTFLALLTPLGEGMDEPWHFAYVQYASQHHGLFPGQAKFISKEVDQFLRIHPASWSVHNNSPFVQTYEDYWTQSEETRNVTDNTIRELRFTGEYEEASGGDLATQYEGHQPPGYYLIAAPVFAWASKSFSFTSTFLLVRIWTILIASLVIPGIFALTRLISSEPQANNAVLIAALFPGFYPGVVRVSNDALMAVLACWFFVALVAYLKLQRPGYLYCSAALMVAGLWTKAFFVPILAGTILILLLYRMFRPALILFVVSVLGWPWYVLNLYHSGAITGLPETVQSHITLADSFHALWRLDWDNLVKVLRSSHIWIGNWSFLGIRSWMYQSVFWLFILGLFGWIRRPRQLLDRTVLPLIILYFAFSAALVYYATQVFLHTGLTVAEGWYLTSFIPIESVLFTIGALALLGKHARWLIGLFELLCLTIAVYSSLFIAFPYYSGFTNHNASGSLTTFHPALPDFVLMVGRLMRYEPGISHIVPWLLLSIFVFVGGYRIVRENS